MSKSSSGPAAPANPAGVKTGSLPRQGAMSGSGRSRYLSRPPHRAARQPVTGHAAQRRRVPSVAAPDGTFWVASRSGDVRHVDAGARAIEQVALPGPVVSLVMAPDGTLGGLNGEILPSGRSDRRIGASQGMPRGWVRDILVILTASCAFPRTAAALGHLSNGRMARLTMTEGLPDNRVVTNHR